MILIRLVTQGGFIMAKVDPFHSKRPEADVYHNNDKCTKGNNIESYNRISGTGGHPLCEECAGLPA